MPTQANPLGGPANFGVTHKHHQSNTRESPLRRFAPAEEMNKEEDKRQEQQKVNHCGGNMENHKCPNPSEEQQKREGQEYKSHEKSPWPIIARFS